ncbi:MAG TPA: hypothetical protein VII37_01610 [Candidatus Acidoferrum sp.]
MATESKLDEAADILAKIVKEQIKSLPPAVVVSKRKTLLELATSFQRSR